MNNPSKTALAGQRLDRIVEPQAEAKLRTKVRAGFALAIILTCALSFFSWRIAQQATEDADWVAHTHEVSTTLEATLRHLVDVESGARGFALTGREPFLEPFEAGKRAVAQDLERLHFLIVDTNQLRRLDTLKKQTNARIDSAESVVAIRRRAGESPTAEQLEQGKLLMDESRATVAEMESGEKRLLEQRSDRARTAQRLELSLIAMGALAGLIFLSIAGSTVSREIGISARARAQVVSLNTELEHRVEQRTAALRSEIMSREKAEVALRESEGRTAGIIQSAMDSIITVDEEHRIVLFNNAAERVFLCPAAEAIGKPVTHFIPPRFHDSHAQHIHNFSETGITNRAMGPKNVLWAMRADGREFPIEASISQVVTGGKKLFTVILRDVSERKQAEAMRERLAAIVESSDDAIISKTLDGTITAWNRGAEKVFGYSSSEAVGKKMWMIIPIERAQEEIDILARIARGESVEHYETIRIRKDGKPINVSVTISPIRDHNGMVVAASKIARDITERKQKEEELRESEERFRLFIEHAPAALAMFDREMRYLHVSRRWRSDYGLGDRDVRGISHYELFPELPERWKQIHSRCLAGEILREENDRFDRPDGTVQWIRWEVRPWHDRTGGIAGIVIFAEDTTESRNAEEAQRQSDARRKFAMETARLGDWELDLRTLQASCSPVHDQIFGSQSPLPHWGFDVFLSHVHPDDREWVKGSFQGSVSQGKRLDFECRIVWPNGDIRWIWACGSHYRGISGSASRMFGIVEDITERKRIQNALRDSEERLRLAIEGARLGTWNWDLKTGELFGSPLAFAMFGLPADTKFDFEIFLGALHPDDREMVDAAMKRALAQQVEYDVEYRCIWSDGTARWIAAKGRAYTNEAGEPIRVGGIVFDVTDRRRALEHLRESEERFQAMANGIPQLAWMAEADGHIFWYNQRWYDYTGTTLEQMEGWGWQGVHDPEALPSVLEGWRRSIACGEPFDMEFPLRGADGLYRIFLTRVMPVRDVKGRVTRWFGTNTDISDRKKSERQLAEQAEELERSRQALETQTLMLQSVLDSMVEGLVAADEQGKFIIWNPAAAKIVGLNGANVPPEEWSAYYGAYLPDTVTPFPTEQNPLLRAIRGEVSSAEIFIRNPELEQGAWIESNGSPLRDKNGVVRGGVVAFRDVTQKKAAELEIRELNESLEERIAERTAQLESANRELETFTYSVSHDLRAPLRRIQGFAGALSEEFGTSIDPGALHYLERIKDGTHHMSVLINELLNLARTGQQALHPQLTALNSLVEEIISMLKPETEGREVEWKVGSLPSVECDPVLVRQIFQNLLSNAIKYSRPRKHAVIEIGRITQKDRPVIFVRDNGAGFDMKYADKLFGVFQRLHRAEDFEGTGVGLATVHRIVQKHGGRIWAEAELDRGATFYFTLGGSEVVPLRSEAATSGG